MTKKSRIVKRRTVLGGLVGAGMAFAFGSFDRASAESPPRLEPARLFVPGHHDNFVSGISARGETYEAPLRAELARLDSSPELRFMSDPMDYLNPGLLTFSV